MSGLPLPPDPRRDASDRKTWSEPAPLPWYRSLAARLALMLTLGLLPLGLIALSQTWSVAEKARENAELALLSLTREAAVVERYAIERAFSTIDVVGTYLPQVVSDTDACSRFLANVQDGFDRFGLIAFMPTDGQVECSSTGEKLDFTQLPYWQELIEQPAPRVFASRDGEFSQQSVIVVSAPYFVGEEVRGALWVSIPLNALHARTETSAGNRLLDLVTFNDSGQILTSGGDPLLITQMLPRGRDLESLAVGRAHSFSARVRGGETRIFTVTPIERDRIYALGVWGQKGGLTSQIVTARQPALFPLLMWIVSLGVSMYAVHDLVTRHVAHIRRRMNRFARDRQYSNEERTRAMPREIAEINQSFDYMAGSILHDEAELENAVRQKNVLLKEVHHRVKNNLQLISSMINMQVRQAEHDEARQALRKVQDRVLSLATIHRDLYQSEHGGMVDVAALICEVAENAQAMTGTGGDDVDMTLDLDTLLVFPDQAIPLSLLASETITNAVKYAGPDAAGVRSIHISLRHAEDRMVQFEIANSIGTEVVAAEGTGLGARLIRAFGTQLGAELRNSAEAGVYRIVATFRAAEFRPEAGDF